jgi:hypothetical protein
LSIGVPLMPANDVDKGSVKSLQNALQLAELHQRHAARGSSKTVELHQKHAATGSSKTVKPKPTTKKRPVEVVGSESEVCDDIPKDVAVVLKESGNLAKEPLVKKFKASSLRYANVVKKLKNDAKAKLASTDRMVADLSKKVDAYRTDFDKLFILHAGKISDMKVSQESALDKAAAASDERLENEARFKQMEKNLLEIIDKQDERFEKIKIANNDLRYAQKFDISASRDIPWCVMSLSNIMPMESVVALLSPCQCNCMIKADKSYHYIKMHHEAKSFKCPKCRSAVVYDIEMTTAMQAEHSFAWRVIENLTGCNTDVEIMEKRLVDLQKLETDKTTQDNLAYREKLAAIVSTAEI